MRCPSALTSLPPSMALALPGNTLPLVFFDRLLSRWLLSCEKGLALSESHELALDLPLTCTSMTPFAGARRGWRLSTTLSGTLNAKPSALSIPFRV